MKKKYYYYALCIIIIFIGLFISLRFTILTGNLPWFHPRLCIDGESYIKGMISIVSNNDFLNLEDIYHSPGYQIYLAVMYKIFPNKDKIFQVIKVMSWIMSVLSVGLIFYLGEKYFKQYVGAIAGILFSFSYKYYVYNNLLQYEVLVGFLLLLYMYFLGELKPSQPKYIHNTRLSLLGIIVSAICLIQVRYIFIVPFSCVIIYLKDKVYVKSKKLNNRSAFFSVFMFMLPFILIFGTWSAYYSLMKHAITIGSNGLLWRFNIGNNLNSQGFAFPYPKMVEPTGIRFIISYPGRFLWLVKERFLYLWDFKKDIWYLGHPLISKVNTHLGKSVFDVPFYFICFITFLGGILIKIRADIKQKLMNITSSFYLTFLAAIIGPLVVFSSSRFIIPVISIVVLFQSYFIVRLFQTLKKLV